MKYKKYNDYELLYMVRESNDDIKDLLYGKYQPVLRKISSDFYEKYKYYGYEYEDFYQEAVIAFERAIINYDENKESLFYTFVNLCIKRALISFCRNISNDKKNIANIYYSDIDDNIISDTSIDLDRTVINNELMITIRRYLLNLSLDYSSILELKINGFSYREIAILLDIPTSTVEYRIRKIRKKLKYCYK